MQSNNPEEIGNAMNDFIRAVPPLKRTREDNALVNQAKQQMGVPPDGNQFNS